tara:strand:+ start:580 stop:1617 length:1038 start_codon:yes stop_codon:yes gene_type:complete
MAFEDAIKFKGVTSLFKDGIANTLLLGVQDFFSWGFLNVGGFQNITRRDPSVSGVYGNELFYRYRLRPSDDPNYEIGQVWEGFRNDWVWESGVSYDGVPPIEVSGVWVNDIFYKPDNSAYTHYVDYPNGRIVFDYPIVTDTVVETSFSHRTVGVCLGSEKFIQELMYDSYDMNSLDEYLAHASGTRTQLGERRLQLPVVALELVKEQKREGYALGGGQIVYNDILFHVFADNEFQKNNIRDTIMSQNEKVFYLINRGLMKESTRHGNPELTFPHQLDHNGSPVPSSLMYPSLVVATGDRGFRERTARFEQMSSTDMPPVNSWLHRSTVRATFSVILGGGTNIGQV